MWSLGAPSGAVPLDTATILLRLGAAIVLALPLAWEREQAKSLGLRTIPLVSLGACGYLLLDQNLGAGADSASRVLQGVLAGIGFVGGGAILKHRSDVVGLATAASVWNSGAIGSATAYGQFKLALILALFNVVVLVAGEIERKVTARRRLRRGEPPGPT